MKNKNLAFSAFRKNDVITYLSVIVATVLLLVLQKAGLMSRFFSNMLVPICYTIILAVSLNLTVGFLGELTLGHAGFMSVGAYCGCLVSTALVDVVPTAVRYPIALIVGGLVAALFGILIGIPVLRLRGDYLAIVTLAFGEIIKGVIQNLKITGGPSGLKTGAIQDATFLSSAIIVLLMLFLITNLVNSKHGRAITAIRDNRIAAEATGINVTFYRLLAFVVAAFFAGVAGVIYGHSVTPVSPNAFDYNYSIELLVIVVLGGMGNIRGSIIAAVILYTLPEWLKTISDSFQDYRMLIYALLLIFMMLFSSAPQFAKLRETLNFKRLFSKIKGGGGDGTN